MHTIGREGPHVAATGRALPDACPTPHEARGRIPSSPSERATNPWHHATPYGAGEERRQRKRRESCGLILQSKRTLPSHSKRRQMSHTAARSNRVEPKATSLGLANAAGQHVTAEHAGTDRESRHRAADGPPVDGNGHRQRGVPRSRSPGRTAQPNPSGPPCSRTAKRCRG